MPYSLIQQASTGFGTVTSQTLPYGSNVTLGNLLVVFSWGNASLTGISDTMGNVWTQAIAYTGLAGAFENIWYATAKATGATSVTVTQSASTTMAIAVSEWHTTISNPVWAVDVAFVGATASGTTATSAAINTHVASEIVLASIHDSLTGTWQAPFTSGFTGVGGAWGYDLPTTTQTGLTASQTGLSGGWAALIGSFYAAPAPAVFIQAADNGLSATLTCAYGSNVTKGNLLITQWRKSLPLTVTGVTDTVGTIYTIVYDAVDGGGTGGGWAYGFAAGSGPNTVTIAKTGAATMNGIGVGEWTNANNFRSASAVATPNTANPVSSSTVTQPGDLLIGILEANSGYATANVSAGTGYILRHQGATGGLTYFALEDNTAGAGGSQTAGFGTNLQASNTTMGIGAFYFVPPAGGGGSGDLGPGYDFHFHL